MLRGANVGWRGAVYLGPWRECADDRVVDIPLRVELLNLQTCHDYVALSIRLRRAVRVLPGCCRQWAGSANVLARVTATFAGEVAGWTSGR